MSKRNSKGRNDKTHGNLPASKICCVTMPSRFCCRRASPNALMSPSPGKLNRPNPGGEDSFRHKHYGPACSNNAPRVQGSGSVS